MNLEQGAARIPWLFSSKLPRSAASTRNSGDEARAGTKREEAEEHARSSRTETKRGAIAAAAVSGLSLSAMGRREKSSVVGATLLPLGSLLSQSRCDLKTSRGMARASNWRENSAEQARNRARARGISSVFLLDSRGGKSRPRPRGQLFRRRASPCIENNDIEQRKNRTDLGTHCCSCFLGGKNCGGAWWKERICERRGAG